MSVRLSFATIAFAIVPFTSAQDASQHLRGAANVTDPEVNSSVFVASTIPVSVNLSPVQKVEDAQRDIDAAVARSASNSTISSSWFGWQHGIGGETCCMCSVQMGSETLLYSAEDYNHWFGSHAARWQCDRECARKCGSDWHHGRYFGCYDESHLRAMDNRCGHTSGYRIYYGHFGGIC